jgi:hypothetical protein
MNNPIWNLLVTTNRWFVLIGIVVSTVVWMLWYGPALFGNLYGKFLGMNMDTVTPEEGKAGMMRSMPRELLSRLLYFIGLGYALEIGWWTSLGMCLLFAFVVWLVFVLPANMSQTARSTYSMKMLWLVAGNTLVSTLITTTIRFYVF